MRYSGLRGFEVDDEFESGRLHNGQVGRLGAPEYLASVDADLVPRVCEGAAVADQSTGRNALAPSINRRQGIPRRQHDDLAMPDREERLVANEKSLDPTLCRCSESRLDIGTCDCSQERELHSKRSRRRHHLDHVWVRSIIRIDEYGGRNGLGIRSRNSSSRLLGFGLITPRTSRAKQDLRVRCYVW